MKSTTPHEIVVPRSTTTTPGAKPGGRRPLDYKFYVDENGCEICYSHTARKGDGATMVACDTSSTELYKLRYEAKYGTLPEGFRLRRRCENSACSNPDHYNARRANEDFTPVKQSGLFKVLTAQQIREIAKSDEPYSVLRDRYKVTFNTISRIKLKSVYAKQTVGISLKESMQKLSPQDVVDIYNSKETGVAMARKYGISRDQVSNIRTGKAHKNITTTIPGNSITNAPVERKLSFREVTSIIFSTKSARTLAAELDVSVPTIRGIRAGRLYKDVMPYLDRSGDAPAEEGITVAKEFT